MIFFSVVLADALDAIKRVTTRVLADALTLVGEVAKGIATEDALAIVTTLVILKKPVKVGGFGNLLVQFLNL